LAKAGIHGFQSPANLRDPGFHRDEEFNSSFSHLEEPGRGEEIAAVLFVISPASV
jgi:hypothetical protein